MARPRKEPETVEPTPKIIEPTPEIKITNEIKGRTLHLGDGRKLAYGESAEVTPEIAALLA